jgi:hypothetical protein
MKMNKLFEQILQESKSDDFEAIDLQTIPIEEWEKLSTPEQVFLIESKRLKEMSVLCHPNDGFGIEIKTWSNDHPPAHAHVKNASGGDENRFLITDHRPRTPDSVVPYPGDSLTTQQRKAIVKWANKKSDGVYNWVFLKREGKKIMGPI